MYVTAYQKDSENFIVISKSGPKPNNAGYYRANLSLKKPIHFGGLLRALNVLAVKIG